MPKRVRFHFLNVGKGDCTIIEHAAGNISMVDINNCRAPTEEQVSSANESFKRARTNALLGLAGAKTPFQGYLDQCALNSFLEGYKGNLQDPIDYFQSLFSGRSIFRFISTHPDMDHLSGLYRLAFVEKIPIANFWHTRSSKSFSKKDFDGSPYKWEDWQSYCHLINQVSPCTICRFRQGDQYKYFNRDDQGGPGDQLYVWAPNARLETLGNTPDSKGETDTNHLSYVLTVELGGLRAILGGDAFGDEEVHPINTWTEVRSWLSGLKYSMKSTLLKASHHGHKSGYNMEAIKEIAPRYTIISNTAGNEDARTDLYRQWSDYVISTFWCGNIIVDFHEGEHVDVFTQKDRFNSQYTDPESGYYLLPEGKRRFNGTVY